MSEVEWLAGSDPLTMLDVAPLSARKARLLAAAFCRLVRDSIRGDAEDCLDVVERYADGRADWLELATASAAAQAQVAKWRRNEGYRVRRGTVCVWQAAGRDALAAARTVAEALTGPSEWEKGAGERAWRQQLRTECAQVIRELLANPFRPVQIEPHWLALNDRLIPRLAEEIYQRQDYRDLPVLADALEDVGAAPALLDHCRRREPHRRGCWAVDALLDKR